MADLTKIESALLKDLMRSDGWEFVLRLLGTRIDDLRAKPVVGQNAFEVLRSLHLRDGGVDELKSFFDYLENGAFAK